MRQIIRTLIVLSFSSCQSNAQYHTQGQALVTSYFYGKESGEIIDSFQFKIWWKDGTSIQEVPLIKFEEDARGNRKRSVVFDHYSYLDSQRNICFNFRTFADTATAIKVYFDIDSVKKGGGWNYLSKEGFKYDRLQHRGDTIINSEKLQKLVGGKIEGESRIDFYLYTKCKIEPGMVRLYKPLSDSLGCTIIKSEMFIDGKHFTDRQITYLSDSLTTQESTVFEAWSRKEANKKQR